MSAVGHRPWVIAAVLAGLLSVLPHPSLGQPPPPAQGESALSLYLRTVGRLLGDPAQVLTELPAAVRLIGLEHDLARLYTAGEYHQAIPLAEEAARLTAQRMDTDPVLHAKSFNNLGLLYGNVGEYAKAESLYQRSLDIWRKVGRQVEDADYLATLNNLAQLYHDRGELTKAEELYREVLVREEKLLGDLDRDLSKSVAARMQSTFHERVLGAPTQGDPYLDFAKSLSGLAGVCQDKGGLREAETHLRRALEVVRTRRGEAHPLYGAMLSNLGLVCVDKDDLAEAEQLFLQALEIEKAALGEGHPDVAVSLHNLASLYRETGAYDKAESLHTQALAIHRKVLGEKDPAYVVKLTELAGLYSAMQQHRRATQVAREALQIRLRFVRELAPALSEAENLNLLARRSPGLLDFFLSSSRPAGSDANEVYADVWAWRGLVHRVMARRLQTFREVDSPQIRELVAQYQQCGRSLERLLAPNGSTLQHVSEVRRRWTELAAEKERLERQLAATVPQFRSELEAAWRPAEDLARALPQDAVFIDLLAYGYGEFRPGPGGGAKFVRTHNYAAFLEQLSVPASTTEEGYLLAVGGVSYDGAPLAAPSGSPAPAQITGAAVRGERPLHWPALPGARGEVEAVVRAAANRPTRTLTEAEASTSLVLARLPGARWAHVATHGFFADPEFRSALQLDEQSFDVRGRMLSPWGERRTLAGRNPLVLSGLVFAGANLPRATDELGLPSDDGGILTAEAVTALPLQKLELVVLSACETGLGEVAGGEGLFGLQRAFHLAGARNVIASLWKVEDQATAALMRLFYYELWQQGQPPVEALRQAQLAIYRNPDKIRDWASLEGEAFAQTLRGPVLKPTTLPAKDHGEHSQAPTTDPRKWAAFILSGPGR